MRTVAVPTISPQAAGTSARVGSIVLSAPSLGGSIPAHFETNGTVSKYIIYTILDLYSYGIL